MSDEYYSEDDGTLEQESPASEYAAALEQQQEQYMHEAAAQLAAEHPELGRQADAEALVSNARKIAEQLGAEHLAADPAWWKAVHEGHLQPRDDRDPGDIIVDPWNGQGGRHVLPF